MWKEVLGFLFCVYVFCLEELEENVILVNWNGDWDNFYGINNTTCCYTCQDQN